MIKIIKKRWQQRCIATSGRPT